MEPYKRPRRTFKVYHATNPTFDVTDAAFFPAGYDFIATVRDVDLDAVWAHTQNVALPWIGRENVTRHTDRFSRVSGERSTSVGDVIYDVENGLHYAVSSAGFELFRPRTTRETSKERATS